MILSIIDPVALEIGPLSIRWYGVIIATGMLIGYLLADREATKKKLPKDVIPDLVMVTIISALICARLYYVIFEWSNYQDNLMDIFKVYEGGMAIHGGLIGAFLAGYIFCKVKGYSFFQLADIAAPSIILGQAIGRWGNFINQEAHGGEVSRQFLESLMLPEFIINQMNINGAYYHPTFLYESLWSIIGFIILLLIRPYLKIGETFLTYLIYYSVGRFFIEGMRTDSLMLTELLRVAQVISIVIIVVSIAMIVYRRIKQTHPKYRDVEGNYIIHSNGARHA